ncbi:MAG: M23 family metallopeptidase [Candidatus Dadabacteria bacterium]|nr:MAG: M23 family metallopeptidase [Candidatus Dadabacteria bacterium]
MSSKEQNLSFWFVSPYSGIAKKVVLSKRGLLLSITAGFLFLISLAIFILYFLNIYFSNYLLNKDLKLARYESETLSVITHNLAARLTKYEGDVNSLKSNYKEISHQVKEVLTVAKILGISEVEDEAKGGLERVFAPAVRGSFNGYTYKGQNQEIPFNNRVIGMIRDLPVGMPAVGLVSSWFGRRISPFTKRLSFHYGVDISLAYGSEVKATANGIVTRVQRTPTYGLMIEIKHRNGVTTRYAHLSKVLVRRRARVCQGQVIALSGSSGRSTGPHLHYEIRVRNKPINPALFMNWGMYN